jgi:TatD DNase family protein
MRFIDSHCHLNAEHFTDDAAEVLAAAELAGLERILVPGWDVPSCERALALAARLPGVLVGVGTHPHAAAGIDEAAWARIVELARDPAVAAIGETGLDFDRMWSPADAQLTNLRRNLALAIATGKPAILHCRSKAGARDAQDALLAELRAAGFGGEVSARAFAGRPPAILHSVSGPVDYVEAALELGCAVSVSGLAFRKGEEATAEAVRRVPAGRLLVETDAPYLSPPGAPRRRNEPQYAEITARWVATQRGEHPDAVGEALVAAFDATFDDAGLADRRDAPPPMAQSQP